MARDWKAILAEFQADTGRALITRVHDDDGIFEALWSYVGGSAKIDDGLADAMAKKTALGMLLRLAVSTDDVCHALLMDKENSFELLLDWAHSSGNLSFVKSAELAMRTRKVLCLDFSYPGTDWDHLNEVVFEIESIESRMKHSDSWYPLRLLHSVLNRARRAKVFWNSKAMNVVRHGTLRALKIIAGLSLKAKAANQMSTASQLQAEHNRWYDLHVLVSANMKVPPAAQASHVTVEVPGMGRVTQPERKRPWGARPLEHAPLHSLNRSAPPPSSPAGTTATPTDGQGEAQGVRAGEIERRLVDAAVQGEQQLLDLLLALVAPDFPTGSSETLQEFYQLKCRVRNGRDVGAVLRFGASLVHWVASPDEGLGRHLSDLGTSLRAFADGLDEGLGTGEKYDTIMRAFATIGSKPGFRLPRGTALVLSKVVGCLEHGASSAGPVSSAASTAARILASILTGGYPGQDATDADAVYNFSGLRGGDNGVPLLQKLFQLLTMLTGEAREAMAHVILILLEHTGQKSQHVETLGVLASTDHTLRTHLRLRFSIEPGPWTLRLGLWLHGAMKDVLQVSLTKEPLLASLMDKRSFLLAAALWGSGGALSQAAASVLFGVPTTWWAELEDLAPIRLIQAFATCLGPVIVDQVLSSLDEDQRAALLQALMTHWAVGPLQAKQRVPLTVLIFLIPSGATLSHLLVTDAGCAFPVVKRIVDVARTFLDTCSQEDSATEDSGEYSPNTLDELSKTFRVHMGSVVAGLACRCIAKPCRNGVRSVLRLAFQVLSNDFEPQKRWWLEHGRRGEGVAVLESVLGLLEKGRPQPTLADPQVLQALRERSDLVDLIRKHAYEAAACSNVRAGSQRSDVLGVVTAILRHLGVVGCLSSFGCQPFSFRAGSHAPA